MHLSCWYFQDFFNFRFMMCLGLVFFLVILFISHSASWICRFLSFAKFEVFCNYFSEYMSASTPFPSLPWYLIIQTMDLLLFLHMFLRFCSFFFCINLSLCWPDWKKPTVVSFLLSVRIRGYYNFWIYVILLFNFYNLSLCWDFLIFYFLKEFIILI
jgi:hypothetical protein